MYDVTSEASFARVLGVKQHATLLYLHNTPSLKSVTACQVDGSIVLAIAGNKQDSDPADWRVPHAEASSFAAAVGASHFRTSAKTGDGVDALFADAAQRGLAARVARPDAPGARLRPSAVCASAPSDCGRVSRLLMWPYVQLTPCLVALCPGGRGQGTAASGTKQKGLIVLDERLEPPAPQQSSCC